MTLLSKGPGIGIPISAYQNDPLWEENYKELIRVIMEAEKSNDPLCIRLRPRKPSGIVSV